MPKNLALATKNSSPAYYVHANGPKTGRPHRIPIFDVPESEHGPKRDAELSKQHLEGFGWTSVWIEKV